MTDVAAFLRYRCAVQRAGGLQTGVFEIDDVEAILDENEQLHDDNLELIDENQERLDV